MLHKIALHLAQRKILLRTAFSNEHTIEERAYYIELFLENFFTLSFLVLLSVILHFLAETTVFLLFFMWFRGNTGGYHTKSTIGCFLLSISVALCASYIAKYLYINVWILLIISCSSFAVIFLLAPVNHPELILSEEEINQCKKTIKRISFLSILFLTCMFIFNGGHTLIRSAVLAILTTALSIVIAKILKQEVNTYETNEN